MSEINQSENKVKTHYAWLSTLLNTLKSLLLYWAKLLKVFTICLETGVKHTACSTAWGSLELLLLRCLYVGNYFLWCMYMYELKSLYKSLILLCDLRRSRLGTELFTLPPCKRNFSHTEANCCPIIYSSNVHI